METDKLEYTKRKPWLLSTPEKNPETIPEMLGKFMENPNSELCSNGTFEVREFKNLTRLLNNESGFFVIFNNAGGKRFTIWEFDDEETALGFSKHVEKWIYAYRINKTDTIIKSI